MDYRVLGSIEIWRDDEPVIIAAGKQRALLAYLLIHPNRVVLRDELVDALWGVESPATAVKNLQVLVSQLRRSLGEMRSRRSGAGICCHWPTERPMPSATSGCWRPAEASSIRRDRGTPRRPSSGPWACGVVTYADVAYEDFARDEIARLEERRLTGEDDRHEAMLAAGRQPEQAQTKLHSMVVRKVPRRLARGSSSKADAYAWEIGQPGLKKGSGFWLS